jgi:hypothetical protein
MEDPDTMSDIDTIKKAQHDVGQMQSALSTVQTGLGTVEVVVEGAEQARRSFRRFLKIALPLVLVGLIAAIVLRRRAADEPDPTEH